MENLIEKHFSFFLSSAHFSIVIGTIGWNMEVAVMDIYYPASFKRDTTDSNVSAPA